MPSRTLVAALAAEVIGTFLFFVVGAGAVIMDAQTGGAVGLIAIVVTIFFRDGIWGALQRRFGWSLFPTHRFLKERI